MTLREQFNRAKEELNERELKQNYPSETKINMLGFELQNVTPNGCYVEMEKPVCMKECYPEEASRYTQTITMQLSMPLPDNAMTRGDGFHMYYQCYEDFYTLGYFSTLPQAVKYFKDNFEKIARKIGAYGTVTLYVEGFKFEKVELPGLYTTDKINKDNLFELEPEEPAPAD